MKIKMAQAMDRFRSRIDSKAWTRRFKQGAFLTLAVLLTVILLSMPLGIFLLLVTITCSAWLIRWNSKFTEYDDK